MTKEERIAKLRIHNFPLSLAPERWQLDRTSARM